MLQEAPEAGRAVSAYQSLEKAFRVLELLGSRSPRGVGEVASELGLEKSGVSRLLEALAELGYAAHGERRGQYALGARVLALAGAYLRGDRLVAEAVPVLRRLADSARASAHLAVWIDGQPLVVAKEASPERIQVSSRLGTRLPLHASALGKVLLATMPEAGTALASPLPRFTAGTITSLRALRAEMREVQRRGYATEAEEEHPGVGCLAAPVLDHGGACIAALSIAGPVQGTPFRLDEKHARLVVAAARELARRLALAEPQHQVTHA